MDTDAEEKYNGSGTLIMNWKSNSNTLYPILTISSPNSGSCQNSLREAVNHYCNDNR